MTGRWFNVLVVLFWLATMSWLITAKVLPPLLVGEPPTYRDIIRESADEAPPGPSLWHLFFNSREVGWARNETLNRTDGMVEMRGEVHFRHLPWDEISPFRLGSVAELGLGDQQGMSLDAENSVLVDRLGRPEEFRSKLQLGLMPEAIEMQGRVAGNELALTVRIGGFRYPTKLYLPNDAILSDVLSPQPKLPHLKVGQTWTVPVYSPFSPPNQPMQVLKAVVEREETVVWGGRGVRTRVVVYRGDQGAGLGRAQSIHGKAWVRGDGVVVRQEVNLMQNTLRFELLAPNDPIPSEMQVPARDGGDEPHASDESLSDSLPKAATP